MQLFTFLDLDPTAVASILSEPSSTPLGVAMPYNGTRRWYLRAVDGNPDSLYSAAYAQHTRRRMWEIAEMLFADGVVALYIPLIGRALAERGPAYMAYAVEAIRWLADADAQRWYQEQHITVSFYGDWSPLPEALRQELEITAHATRAAHNERYLRYGIFADQPTPDLIARTLRLAADGKPPTEADLLIDYYGAPAVPAGMWIGTDQPTVFDVPLVVHGHTALYFLQFPTPFLDRALWRRILFDYLYVRGEEEALHPDHDPSARHILGLGERQDGLWRPSMK